MGWAWMRGTNGSRTQWHWITQILCFALLHYRCRTVVGNFHWNGWIFANDDSLSSELRTLAHCACALMVHHCSTLRLTGDYDVGLKFIGTSSIRSRHAPVFHSLISSLVSLVPPECENPMQRCRLTLSRFLFIVVAAIVQRDHTHCGTLT